MTPKQKRRIYAVPVNALGTDEGPTFHRCTALHSALRFVYNSGWTLDRRRLKKAARSAKRAGAKVDWRKIAFALADGSSASPY